VNDVEYCRDQYLPTAEIFQSGPHVNVLSGCWNILHSLQAGYETGKEFIFHVEEDIFVAPGFFEWHWNAHESDNYFVTCGRRHGHHHAMPKDFYSNPGTAYRRKSLELVIPHINDDYFKNTEKYVDKHWPQYKGMDGSLDDGMIRKIQRSVNGKVLCAEPRVCVHSGFHYYNRLPQYRNNGTTIQEKIQILREMLSKINREDRYTSDFESF